MLLHDTPQAQGSRPSIMQHSWISEWPVSHGVRLYSCGLPVRSSPVSHGKSMADDDEAHRSAENAHVKPVTGDVMACGGAHTANEGHSSSPVHVHFKVGCLLHKPLHDPRGAEGRCQGKASKTWAVAKEQHDRCSCGKHQDNADGLESERHPSAQRRTTESRLHASVMNFGVTDPCKRTDRASS